uniref:Uncharacterized protein n=1 Tax=Anguilla anguilla TaxID=7936 RepID=A0A0E9PCJ2_ANGAN
MHTHPNALTHTYKTDCYIYLFDRITYFYNYVFLNNCIADIILYPLFQYVLMLY